MRMAPDSPPDEGELPQETGGRRYERGAPRERRNEPVDERGRHVWRAGREETSRSRDERGRSFSPPARFAPRERTSDRSGRSPPRGRSRSPRRRVASPPGDGRRREDRGRDRLTNKEAPLEATFPCQICEKKFSKETVLNAHLKSVHKIDWAEWQTLQDPATGAYYYFNTRTKESSWYWPPQPQVAYTAASGGATSTAAPGSLSSHYHTSLADMGAQLYNHGPAMWSSILESSAKPAPAAITPAAPLLTAATAALAAAPDASARQPLAATDAAAWAACYTQYAQGDPQHAQYYSQYLTASAANSSVAPQTTLVESCCTGEATSSSIVEQSQYAAIPPPSAVKSNMHLEQTDGAVSDLACSGGGAPIALAPAMGSHANGTILNAQEIRTPLPTNAASGAPSRSGKERGRQVAPGDGGAPRRTGSREASRTDGQEQLIAKHPEDALCGDQQGQPGKGEHDGEMRSEEERREEKGAAELERTAGRDVKEERRQGWKPEEARQENRVSLERGAVGRIERIEDERRREERREDRRHREGERRDERDEQQGSLERGTVSRHERRGDERRRDEERREEKREGKGERGPAARNEKREDERRRERERHDARDEQRRSLEHGAVARSERHVDERRRDGERCEEKREEKGSSLDRVHMGRGEEGRRERDRREDAREGKRNSYERGATPRNEKLENDRRREREKNDQRDDTKTSLERGTVGRNERREDERRREGEKPEEIREQIGNSIGRGEEERRERKKRDEKREPLSPDRVQKSCSDHDEMRREKRREGERREDRRDEKEGSLNRVPIGRGDREKTRQDGESQAPSGNEQRLADRRPERETCATKEPFLDHGPPGRSSKLEGEFLQRGETRGHTRGLDEGDSGPKSSNGDDGGASSLGADGHANKAIGGSGCDMERKDKPHELGAGASKRPRSDDVQHGSLAAQKERSQAVREAAVASTLSTHAPHESACVGPAAAVPPSSAPENPPRVRGGLVQLGGPKHDVASQSAKEARAARFGRSAVSTAPAATSITTPAVTSASAAGHVVDLRGKLGQTPKEATASKESAGSKDTGTAASPTDLRAHLNQRGPAVAANELGAPSRKQRKVDVLLVGTAELRPGTTAAARGRSSEKAIHGKQIDLRSKLRKGKGHG